MGLGNTRLDAQPHVRTISCKIKPYEMRDHGYCKVRLQTWGQNGSPPANPLPPHPSSQLETNFAQQCSNSDCTSSETDHSNNMTCSVEQKDPHVYSTLWKKFEVSNHSTWALTPKLDELPKPFDDTTSSQPPGSLIEDNKLKHICMIEVAGTGRWFLGSSLASAH